MIEWMQEDNFGQVANIYLAIFCINWIVGTSP